MAQWQDDSSMSSAQVEQRIVDAYAIADIDGSGQVDALDRCTYFTEISF